MNTTLFYRVETSIFILFFGIYIPLRNFIQNALFYHSLLLSSVLTRWWFNVLHINAIIRFTGAKIVVAIILGLASFTGLYCFAPVRLLAEIVFEDLNKGISCFHALTFFAFLLFPFYGLLCKTLFGSRGVFIYHYRRLRWDLMKVQDWRTSRRWFPMCFMATCRTYWRLLRNGPAMLNSLFLLLFDLFLSVLVIAFHRENHPNNIFVHLVNGLIKVGLLLMEWGTSLLLFFLFTINCRPIGGVMQNTVFSFGRPLLTDFFHLDFGFLQVFRPAELFFQARHPAIGVRRCFKFMDV